MKKAILLLVVALSAYWVSQHRAELSAYWERTKAGGKALAVSPEAKLGLDEEPPEVPSEMVTSAEEKNNAVVSATPSPPPAAFPDLPDGIFYTIERVTFVSSSGVQAIAEGAKVTKVGEENDRYIVDDGRIRMPVSPSKLTHDPKKVAELLQKQSGIVSSASQATAPTTSTVKSPAKTTTSGNSGNQAEATQLRAQIADLDRQIATIQENLNREIAMDNGLTSKGHASTHTAAIVQLRRQLGVSQWERTVKASRLTAVSH